MSEVGAGVEPNSSGAPSGGNGGYGSAQAPPITQIAQASIFAMAAAPMTDVQCEAVEAELLSLGAVAGIAPCSTALAGGEGGLLSRSGTVWEVYFDNPDLAVTLQGWWLREMGGTWLLRVPEVSTLLAADRGDIVFKYEELTEPDAILDRLGMTSHADAFRSGQATSMETLLAQARVLPIARIQTTRKVFKLPSLPAVSGAAPTPSDAELTAILDTSRFDIKNAESEAVSEMLFTYADAASGFLSFSRLDVRVTGDLNFVSSVPSYATRFIEERGLTTANYAGPCPRLMAFLHAWRPAHLRAMVRAQALPAEAKA